MSPVFPSSAMNPGSNPFDPFGSPAPAPAPSGMQYGAPAGMGMSPSPQVSSAGGAAPGVSPYQQYPPQQQYGQGYAVNSPSMNATQQQHEQQNLYAQTQQQYGHPNAQQQQGYPTPVPAPAPGGGYDPFSPAPMQSPSQASNQLVVSQQQTNPYAGAVAPAQVPDYGSQALVPAMQQGSQWGVQQAPGYNAGPSPSYSASGSGSLFDPLAPPPAAPPAPAPAPVYSSPPPAAPPAQPAPVQEPSYDSNPFASYDNSQYPSAGGQSAAPYSEPPPAPAPAPPTDIDKQIIESQQLALSESRALTTHESEPSSGNEVRNKFSQEIARRQAPPGASPLPKAELVRKRGYVLSRISFRTIVMKKWKQSYWVQYGSHTMLWFRNQADFDDWLNNPYHNQARRNFLIKLAVNFVHDLYKPNVRGYQVTQCRSKPYGNKMVRQFKLERWMDYGPTIAAAFGSYDPKEVDALREAIVECMRNTPLDGGIRATGAVRQHHEHQKRTQEERELGDDNGE